MSDDRIVDLAERIGRLEALDEIRRLKHVYQDGVDTRWNTEREIDVAGFVDRVFTDDVVFIAPIDDEGTMARVEGRRAMVDFLTEHHRRSVFSIHIVGNDILQVDGDEAHGQWSVLVPGAGPEGSSWYAARYVETYRRTSSGWRIASSEQFVALNTPTAPWRCMPARGSLR
ncbi:MULTISPECIES: nuclear transport factor 2 family protein [unclassified Microbacterium]|uniref:nuclear transport factor 2 family protein n=1 Tax=Microbacterium sp. CIAB417 TaxID=2860287 RepID=UPI001FAD7BE5|nr:nuclear transport factor 2 family protein [Microbacterium sp. CIAB417]